MSVLIGLLQGDPPSSLLFNVFTNDLEKHFRLKGFRGIKVLDNTDIILLAYADDIVLFSTSPIDLKDKLKSLEEYCNMKKLKINTDKTKIMIFKKRINKKLYMPFTLNDTQIEIVESFKYLGFTLYRTGSMTLEMECRATAAYMATNKVLAIATNNGSVSWSTKAALINSMVESVLLYGSEIWGVHCIDQITQTHSKIFKRMLYLPTNTPYYAVIREAGAKPIEIQILKRVMRWWAKLLNAPEDTYIKSCYIRLLSEHESTENWVDKFKNKFFTQELLPIWHSQRLKINDGTWNYLVDYTKMQLKDSTNQKITDSTSLYWYKDLRDTSGRITNEYLLLNLPTNIINAYCQIRMLNRFNEKIYLDGCKYTFQNKNNCTICNAEENDTLMHLLIKCNITKQIRKHYTENGTEEELIRMMKSTSKQEVTKIVNFVRHSLRIRSFHLNE